VGAVSIVDAVQSAPHIALDVGAIGCDLMAASAYKFFGPHLGIMYISHRLQGLIRPLKVRPSVDAMPTRLMPGTPSFEAMAGTTAAIEHMAWLGIAAGTVGGDASLRQRLVAGLAAAQAHETELMRRFLTGIATVPGVTLHGIANANRLHERVATFTFEIEGHSADAIAADLAARNIFVWNGYYYAWEPAGVLGLRDRGAVRVGFTHYNTLDEVDALIAALKQITG
jgi:selenocysteine lyase/cysteine desulfurase